MDGFSLLELLIALAISAILGVLAYPSYSAYQTNAERNRAASALMQLSANLEVYFSDHGTYETATLSLLNASALTQGIAYHFVINEATVAHFSISAVPENGQARRDGACGILMLTDTNERSISGGGDGDRCWS